jgi:excisionase family DNA binding protein
MTADVPQLENSLYTPERRPADRDLDEELLTVREIAQLLKVPSSWVYERTRRRGVARMPHFKLGKYLRFSKPEVRAWLENTRVI